MGTLDVDFHQFTIRSRADLDEPVQDSPAQDLLFAPRRAHVAVLSGIASGPVAVTTQRLDTAPDQVADGWEDVAEVSLAVDAGEALRVVGWTRELPEDEARLDVGPGTYRVRVHARGRDSAYDAAVLEVLEEFLVQAWPAPFAAPVTLAATSKVARGLV